MYYPCVIREAEYVHNYLEILLWAI